MRAVATSQYFFTDYLPSSDQLACRLIKLLIKADFSGRSDLVWRVGDPFMRRPPKFSGGRRIKDRPRQTIDIIDSVPSL